ncbi:MAG: hypothetical protein IKZ87_04280 [Actinomycetaceae bacterium]|nr:hypothetical protein [Actinomycetaceae bacterium]
MNKCTLKTILSSFALCIIMSQPAQAQQKDKVVFPKGLKWQTMHFAAFDASPGVYKETVSDAEKKLAAQIWKKEIDENPEKNIDGTKLSSEVLIYQFSDDNSSHTFTILNIPFQNGCTPPGDDWRPDALYSLCPMRLVVEDKNNQKVSTRNFPKQCIMHMDDKDTPLRENHTEIAWDSPNSTVYFRIFQYGKHIPACDKVIHIE